MDVHAIFGPPGTGKTSTLIKRCNKADSGLFLSYTKAAAQEAASRLDDSSKIRPSTIHSLAFNALGLSRAAVVNDKKLIELGEHTGVPFKGVDGAEELQEGDEYLSVIAYSINKMIPLEEAYDHFGRPGSYDRFFYFARTYTDWKEAYGYWDFNDMLVAAAGRHPGLRKVTFEPIPNIFIDEAQDCSPLQWEVIRRLSLGAKNVYIAGDDDQAIHCWNGADPHGMIDFLEDQSGTMEVLGKSHRVPKTVLDFAKERCLDQIERRVPKAFDPRPADGSITRYGSVADVDPYALYNDGGGMVLARDRWSLDEIRRMLNRDMIPYQGLGIASPWTSKIAQALRKGQDVEIPIHWVDFYAQADLSLPINITLSTIHQAKGREAKKVIVDLTMTPRVLEALGNDRDAELRVMYVALTRTSDELILCGDNPIC